jgi:hypothetical protein
MDALPLLCIIAPTRERFVDTCILLEVDRRRCRYIDLDRPESYLGVRLSSPIIIHRLFWSIDTKLDMFLNSYHRTKPKIIYIEEIDPFWSGIIKACWGNHG